MRSSRWIFRALVIVLVAVMLPVAPLHPARAQDPGGSIETLALQAHLQNQRSGSYTTWIGGQLGDPKNAPIRTPVGEKLDDWQFDGFAGDADLTPEDLARPTLLNFWASWCPPCRAEFPHLVSVALDPGAHAFDVVFVNTSDTASDARVYLAGYSPEIVTTVDDGDRFSVRASIQSLPTSLLLDADGTVLVEHVGTLTPTVTAFLDAVAASPGEGLFVASDYADITPEPVLLPLDLESAVYLERGATAGGTITGDDPQDVYSFEGQTGDEVRIDAQATSDDLDTTLVLVGPDGGWLATNDDIEPQVITDSQITATLTGDGPHLIVVTRFMEAEGYSSGDYDLTLTVIPAADNAAIAPNEADISLLPLPQQDGGTLAYGQTVTGELTDALYEQRWTFVGQRGDLIRLDMRRAVDEAGGLDGYLLLQGPDGVTLAEVDDTNNTVMPVIDAFELPEDGTYTVVVTRFGFANGYSTGTYSLTLDKIGATAGSVGGQNGEGIRWSGGTLPEGLRWLAYQEPVSGSLTMDRVDAWYIFRGREGDVITLRMEATSGDLDPYLILTDAEGYELAANDDAPGGGPDAAIESFTLPASDAYLIRATRYGFENGPSRGEYTLVIESDSEPVAIAGENLTPSPLSYGEIVSGAMDLAAPGAAYTFEGRAGERVTISVQQVEGTLNPALALNDPSGDEIASNRDWTGAFEARLNAFELPEDGSYTVNVYLEDLSTSGEYRLIVLAAPPAEVSPGAFVPADGLDIELVLIWASAADLDLTFKGPAPLDTGGELTDSANDFCASASASPLERLIWPERTAAPGLYTIRVQYQLNCGGQREPVSFILALVVRGQVVDLIGGTLAREGDTYSTLLEVEP